MFKVHESATTNLVVTSFVLIMLASLSACSQGGDVWPFEAVEGPNSVSNSQQFSTMSEMRDQGYVSALKRKTQILPSQMLGGVRKQVTLKTHTNTRNTPTDVRHRERLITSAPSAVTADTLTVRKFRQVTEAASRSLVSQALKTKPDRAVVMALGQLENRTTLDIDGQLFLDTIRAEVIKLAGSVIYFLDTESYNEILAERTRREALPMRSSSQQTVSFGANGTSNNKTDYFFKGQRNIDGRLAPVDYILSGAIYQLQERDLQRDLYGANYFQFHFRLVDVRNGVIIWERTYGSKIEGVLPPRYMNASNSVWGIKPGQGSAQTQPSGGSIRYRGSVEGFLGRLVQ